MIKLIQTYYPMLLGALGETLRLTFFSLCLAFIIGLVFGLMNVGKNRILNLIGTVYVDAIRGVPLLVLGFWIYFGIPDGARALGIQNFRFSAIQAGTVALAMNCGAYMAEIIRAGIQSVDKGQMEASRSLGLSYAKAMRKVVLPQAIYTMIPSIINQFIITLKDTSILSAIGYAELTNVGKTMGANSLQLMESWTIIGLMYMIIIVTLSKVSKKIERRLNRGR